MACKLCQHKTLSLLSLIFLAGLVSGANYYVKNPANCPNTDAVNFPGQSCSEPEEICGASGAAAQCYDTDSLTPPASPNTVSTAYTCQDSCDGGYVVDCYAASDSASPYCDNNGAFLCDQNSTCQSTQLRATTCTGTVWGQSTCGNCLSDYLNCDTDNINCEVDPGATCDNQATFTTCNCVGSACKGNCICTGSYRDCDNSDGDSLNTTGSPVGTGNGCEVLLGSTSCSTGADNNQLTCSICQCDSTYYYCDGSLTDTDGCEVHNTGACTVGSLGGTWSCSAGAGGCYTVGGGTQYACTCVVTKSYFQTGTFTEYSTGAAEQGMLWFKDYNNNAILINVSNSTDASWILSANGCVTWMDGTTQCTASTGGGASQPNIDAANITSGTILNARYNATVLFLSDGSCDNGEMLLWPDTCSAAGGYDDTDLWLNASNQDTRLIAIEDDYLTSADLYDDTDLWTNASVQETHLTDLWVNASNQDTQIQSLITNSSTQETHITELWTNASVQEGKFANYLPLAGGIMTGNINMSNTKNITNMGAICMDASCSKYIMANTTGLYLIT